MTLTTEQIQEIADQLEFGMKCFWRKSTNELLFLPDLDAFPDGEELYADDIANLEAHVDEFTEIESMGSNDAFNVMRDFTEALEPSRTKFRLEDALSNGKPFRTFKFAVDNSDYRIQWFDFKAEKYRKWVVSQVNALLEDETTDPD